MYYISRKKDRLQTYFVISKKSGLENKNPKSKAWEIASETDAEEHQYPLVSTI